MFELKQKKFEAVRTKAERTEDGTEELRAGAGGTVNGTRSELKTEQMCSESVSTVDITLVNTALHSDFNNNLYKGIDANICLWKTIL